MKKNNLAVIYLLALTFLLFGSFMFSSINVNVLATEPVIPQDAIRLRILANSNTSADQKLKLAIRDVVRAKIDTWVDDLDSKSAAKKFIAENIMVLENIVAEEIAKHGSTQSATISLEVTDFPTKIYGKKLYPAGKYDSLVISLGEARGENWWCVLYPPLCFLEINSSSTLPKAPAKKEPAKVDFIVVKWFKKLF